MTAFQTVARLGSALIPRQQLGHLPLALPQCSPARTGPPPTQRPLSTGPWNLSLSPYQPNGTKKLSWCYRPGFLASLIIRNWSKAGQEIQRRLYWGPSIAGGWGRDKEQVPLLPHWAGVSLFLTWNEGRGVSRSQAGGVASVFCPPNLVAVCAGREKF